MKKFLIYHTPSSVLKKQPRSFFCYFDENLNLLDYEYNVLYMTNLLRGARLNKEIQLIDFCMLPAIANRYKIFFNEKIESLSKGNFEISGKKFLADKELIFGFRKFILLRNAVVNLRSLRKMIYYDKDEVNELKPLR